MAAEHGPWMRIERHDARAQSAPARCVDHAQVAPVNAVERPDRSGAPRRRQLGRFTRDVHAPIPVRAASTRAST